MSEDRDERTIKEIIEYLKKQNGNCSNELSKVEGLCLVNYIEYLEKENTILKQTMCNNSLLINENALLKSIIKEVREYIEDRFCFDELSLTKLVDILKGSDK